MVKISLLKLIADFECLRVEEIQALVEALSERYDLRGLDGDSLNSVLELLSKEGLVKVETGCYKLTERGVDTVRRALNPLMGLGSGAPEGERGYC